MAPTIRRPLVLGFLGTGTVSQKNAVALLGDLVESAGKAKFLLPATEAHWTESLEAVADFALENEIPFTLVMDDSSASFKPIKAYTQKAHEKTKVVNVPQKIVRTLASNTNGKLIMLWDDEDNACYDALEAAEQNEVETLDLCAGLHELHFSGNGVAAQDEADEDEADEDEADEDEADEDEADEDEDEDDDLDSLGEEELQGIADDLGINVEALDTWDDVIAAIREAREPEEEGSGEVPTADDVLEWDFPTLKKFAHDNGIEVAPRTRTFGYRKAITEWLETVADKVKELEEEEEALAIPDDAEEALVAAIDLQPLQSAIDSLTTKIDNMSRSFTENFIEIRTAVMSMNGGTEAVKGAQQSAAKATKPAVKKAPTRTAQKPVTPAKKAPAKKAPAKKVAAGARPKAPAAPKPTERPLTPFMHLLGKKLSKAQAREIMVANQNRGRGRPSDDERALVAQAKVLVPQV